MKNFPTFPDLFVWSITVLLLFSCSPKQAYYLQKSPDSNSYSIKNEKGKLELVERGDRNAQMTQREELIMEALYNRYNEMAQTDQ